MCKLWQIETFTRFWCFSHSLQCDLRNTWRQHYMCSLTWNQKASPGSFLTRKSLVPEPQILWTVTGLTSAQVDRRQCHTMSQSPWEAVMLGAFIDINHAGNKVRRCQRTGFAIFLNYGTIDWVLKKQSTVETSVFGIKFYSMKHGTDNLHGICYKLCMTSTLSMEHTTYMV